MPRKKEKPNHGNYFEVKITIGRDPTGKPIRKSFLSKISKADARRQADEYRINRKATEMVGAPLILDENKTVAAWAAEWLDIYKAGKTAATYNTYAVPIRTQIAPYFECVKLVDLRPAHIQQFYKQLPKGKSDSWYKKVHLTLSAILESAVQNEMLTRSPMIGIDPPKGKPTAEKRTYTAAQRERLYNAVTADAEGLAIAILLELGLRREELLALRWEDVDTIRRTVSIRRAVKISRDGGYTIDTTKNTSSVRTLPISKKFCDYLSRYLSVGYIAHAPSGQLVVWHPDNWADRYYTPYMERVCGSLDIPVLRPHELRHTCGTLLYERTRDIYAVSKYLGHASVAITSKIYVHNNVDLLRAIVDKPQEVRQSVDTFETQVAF